MEPTHDPRCEVNRCGDHGPCSCGRDAEVRRERLARMSGEQMVALMLAYGHAREAGRLDTATDDGVNLRDAIRSLARQRDALRKAAEAVTRGGDARCLRGALEVR